MVRKILNENISPIVYHFCPISVMYMLAKYDTFNLTPSGKRRSDKWMSAKGDGTMFPFYMSVTRNGFSGNGYAELNRTRKTGDWNACMVRIKLNSDLINANLNGTPVNAFNDSNAKVVSKKKNINSDLHYIQNDSNKLGIKKFNRNVNGEIAKQIDRNQLSEYEDRILSNSPTIENFSRYIDRVDILFTIVKTGKMQNLSDIYSEIGFIFNKLPNKVFIYQDEKSFNMQSVLETAKNKNPEERTEKEDTMLYKYGDITKNFYYQNKNALNTPLNEFYLHDKDINALSEVSGILYALSNNSISFLNNVIKDMHFESMPNGERQSALFKEKTIEKSSHYQNEKAYSYYEMATKETIENIRSILPAFKNNFINILDKYKIKIFSLLRDFYKIPIRTYAEALLAKYGKVKQYNKKVMEENSHIYILSETLIQNTIKNTIENFLKL